MNFKKISKPSKKQMNLSIKTSKTYTIALNFLTINLKLQEKTWISIKSIKNDTFWINFIIFIIINLSNCTLFINTLFRKYFFDLPLFNCAEINQTPFWCPLFLGVIWITYFNLLSKIGLFLVFLNSLSREIRLNGIGNWWMK
jgi:hypothetical protein